MIEITFRMKKEAACFFEYFQHSLKGLHAHHKINLQYEDSNIVGIERQEESENGLNLIKEIFYSFIMNKKRDDWFRKILAEQYYFQDEEEQQQILEIAASIMEGNREDLAVFVHTDVKGTLKRAIDQIMLPGISFSFDSFVKFRMRPLIIQLEKYVEIAIDEYKMEQEYQMFIQTMRDFLSGRAAKYAAIHLMMEDGIIFLDDNLKEITRSQLSMMIDRKLLFNHPVYIDSVTIAPLLSIAPIKIYLYASDFEQPLVRTIRNIFEERVSLEPISTFYYEHKKLPNTAE